MTYFCCLFCGIFFINICLGFFTFLDWQKQKQIPIDIYQFWSQRSNFWTAAILLNKILYKSVGIWAQCTLKYIKSSKFAQKLWSFRFPSPLHLLLCTMEFYGGIYYFSLNRSAAHQDIKNSTLFPVISKRNWMAVTFFKKEKNNNYANENWNPCLHCKWHFVTKIVLNYCEKKFF